MSSLKSDTKPEAEIQVKLRAQLPAQIQAEPLGESARLFFARADQVWRKLRNSGHQVQTAFLRQQDLCIRIVLVGNGVFPQYLAALGLKPASQQQISLTQDWNFEIRAWDRLSTQIDLDVSGLPDINHQARGEIPSLSSQDILCTYNIDSAVLNLADRERGCAYHCVRDHRHIPQYELGAPFRDLLAWMLSAYNRHLIHAGVVGDARGGLLIVGVGGSGKSNTAVACLEQGLGYVSDDYAVLQSDASPPRAHALFQTCKLFADDEQHFPMLAEVSSSFNATSRKNLYYLQGSSFKLLETLEIKAILLPRLIKQDPAAPHTSSETLPHASTRTSPGTSTRIAPCPGPKAMLALAPSSLFQVAGSGKAALSAIANLAKQLPAYYLELGTDRGTAVNAINRLLDQLK